ncbi:MAG: hypothetical protein QM760_21920 [Nibricoccus sp.]
MGTEGFYIAPNTPIPLSLLRAESDGTFKFFLEAVNTTNATDTIEVSYYGAGLSITDSARVTAVQPVAAVLRRRCRHARRRRQL